MVDGCAWFSPCDAQMFYNANSPLVLIITGQGGIILLGSAVWRGCAEGIARGEWWSLLHPFSKYCLQLSCSK